MHAHHGVALQGVGTVRAMSTTARSRVTPLRVATLAVLTVLMAVWVVLMPTDHAHAMMVGDAPSMEHEQLLHDDRGDATHSNDVDAPHEHHADRAVSIAAPTHVAVVVDRLMVTPPSRDTSRAVVDTVPRGPPLLPVDRHVVALI